MIAQCAMEKFVENTLLYDFYGELLTEHQRRVYEAVVFDDLSLSEAAEQENISRQGVHDIIRRCNTALGEYEQKLHLLEKSRQIKEGLTRIQEALVQSPADLKTIRETAEALLEEL